MQRFTLESSRTQASLPIRFGDVIVRSASKLASSAFLASAASSLSLQTLILQKIQAEGTPVHHWATGSHYPLPGN